jgi:hypothetical protein
MPVRGISADGVGALVRDAASNIPFGDFHEETCLAQDEDRTAIVHVIKDWTYKGTELRYFDFDVHGGQAMPHSPVSTQEHGLR